MAKQATATVAQTDPTQLGDVLTYTVEDTNAKPNGQQRMPDGKVIDLIGARTHEIVINGESQFIEFMVNQKVALPVDVALRFLKDPAFIVRDAAGRRLQPPPANPDVGAAITLLPGQCIANYGELTQNALYLRCKQRAGSEGIGMDASRQILVQFLADDDARRTARATKKRDDLDSTKAVGGTIAGDDMTDEEVARIFPDDE